MVVVLLAASLAFSLIEFNGPESALVELDLYYTRALNLVHHGVFGYGETPTAFYPPGYSFLLVPAAAALGDTKWAWFLTNTVILLASALLLRWQLIRLATPERVANLAAVLLVVHPNRLASLGVPLSDVPFSLLFVLVLGFLLLSTREPRRPLHLVVSALLAGVAVLVRVAGAIVLVPVELWLLTTGEAPLAARLRRAVLFGALCALVIAPWTLRNWLQYGVLVPVSTNGGYNLLIGNNPTASDGWTPYPDSVKAGVKDLNEAEQDAFFKAEAEKWIRENAGFFVLLGLRKLLHTFSSDASAFIALWRHSNLAHLPKSLTTAVFGVSNFVYFLSALGSALVLWRRWGHESDLNHLVVATLLGAAAAVFAFFGMTRYKEPVNTALLLLLAMHAGAEQRAGDAAMAERSRG